jgi:hypothetical protein
LRNRNGAELAQRLREIREDLYGGYGSRFLADALEIPLQTWLNYESGVVMPAEIVLQLIVMASVNPHWLLTGQGSDAGHQRIMMADDGSDADHCDAAMGAVRFPLGFVRD